uniref:Coiled-coil serine-rich protein 2a n=2 Tax=Scleropages formosus TaxID=113540 RepID=A0A8C9RL99_SCLFO
MLDVDLTEDVSLHSDIDGMSQFDRAEKGSRQGQWRRRQHRWTGQDRFHDDNRGGSSQPLDGYPAPGVGRVGHHVPKSGARPEGSLAGLDEVTLRHMAQDCSSVKSQLIKLRNLLQMEDGVKIHKALASELLTPEISEDPGSALQAEKLMREVQELREELRSKERTIAQLTQQLSAHAHTPRCQCQQRAPAGRGERRSHHDKATQTPWRGQSGTLPAPFFSPWQGPFQGIPRASVPHRRQTSNTTVFQPSLLQRAPPPGKTSKNSPHRGPQ